MISVCIITKNEADKLERCLTSIKQADPNNLMEIVIVDTGSTDNTIAMSKKYTDKIFEFEWCDDFSAARNFSINKATGEYILILDSDEYIVEFDMQVLLQLISTNKDSVGRITRIDEYVQNDELVRVSFNFNRFFKKDLYAYRGRIHEQVVLRNTNGDMQKSDDYKTYNTPIKILHDGYNGDITKSKIERNLKLLLKDLEEFGDDPYILYQTGRGYYLAKDYEKACEYYGRALEFDLDPQLEYVKNMVESYGYSLINSDNSETARLLLGAPEVYEAFSSNADFCFMMGLVYMNCAKFSRAIEEFNKATTLPCNIEGSNSYKAYYNIAVIYECLGVTDKALIYYKKCGKYAPAIKRLATLK